MYFSGVHFNMFNIFKVSVGKFFTEDIQSTFQVSSRTHSNRTGYDQVIDIPLRDVVPLHNDAQPGYQDPGLCPGQRNIIPLSMIIIYDSSGHAYQGFRFKGIYVDRYV